MSDYERVLNAVASGEAVDTGDLLTALGDSGKPIKIVLFELREAIRRLDWCPRCGCRGTIRSSRKNELGERTYHIICPRCKQTLSNQKRGNLNFVVYTQQPNKKLLDGSEVES